MTTDDGKAAVEKTTSKQRPPGRMGPVALLVLAVVLAFVGVFSSTSAQAHQVLVRSQKSSTPAMTALDPSQFADGSCIAFEPTAGNVHKTVFLDAGHGGIDPGGVGETSSGQRVAESTVNLAVELQTMALLRSHGYRVVVSRTTDTTVARLTSEDLENGLLSNTGVHNDVAARALCANLGKADLLVGIYQDAAGSAAAAGSVTLYDGVRPFATQNQTFANMLQANVLTALNAQGWQIPDDGVNLDGGYGSSTSNSETAHYSHLMLLGPAQAGYFDTPSLMPGALIEPLYLTDPFEGSLAVNPAAQAAIASGITQAVLQYFTPAKPPKTTTTKAS